MTTAAYWPVIIQIIVALGFVVLVLVGTHLLGPSRKNQRKDANWECGVEVKGNARMPVSIKYFMTAILFVLFDVEVIFFYPYAVNFIEMGIEGFIAVIMFISFFMFGFLYIWKKGALEWDR